MSKVFAKKFILLVIALFLTISTVAYAEMSHSMGSIVENRPVARSGKIIHYDLYISDGYINGQSGVYPSEDPSNIAGWESPVYIWGFSDVDPGGMLTYPRYLNLQKVPDGAEADKGSPVGNAKFPAPFIEVSVGDDVYVTIHNRGFYQEKQQVQDEHTMHLHGIHAQTPYDGFPESAGGYSEKLWMFWRDPDYGGPYKNLNNLKVGGDPLSTLLKDRWWNNLDAKSQQAWMAANTANDVPPVIGKDGKVLNSEKTTLAINKLSPSGGIPSQFNTEDFPPGTPRETIEADSQFTYYFRAEHPGTYMYHCHVAASEHVQMHMFGALIVRPADYFPKDLGAPIDSNYIDKDNNRVVSFDDERKNSVKIELPVGIVEYPAGSLVKNILTVYGAGTNSEYDKEYTFVLSELDPRWHKIIESGEGSFYPPDWKPEIWFVNGRTFPQTVFPFQFNTLEPDPTQKGKTWYKPEPAYNTFISVKPKEKFLVRWVNMGFQSHPMHQHGWHMQVIGTDGMPLTQPYMKFTLHIGSGETYDTITIADPVYGVTVPSGAPLSQKEPGQENSNWPVIYPIHDHNDFQVTTNGIYPGGAVILMAVSDVPNPLPISWFNPYDKTITELGSNKILKKMGVPAENPSQTPPKNPQDGESNPKNTKN